MPQSLDPRSRLRRELEERLATWDGLLEGQSMFGHATAYWVNGREVAHFEDDDVLEIRLTHDAIRQRRAALRSDDRVELRRSGADWLAVRFAQPGDLDFVEGLLAVAQEANQPLPGTVPKLPPTGVELERRRRFH